ncbi:MAG TPA: ATP-dependent DNA ligase, partial [Casimicrobiaceae bacterium]|nr:ATP-dependent DNA ligase [Casimicrobiaceae bacterium]
LVTERFPELQALGDALPDGTVLDGEIVALDDGDIAPFALLSTRIGRKRLSPKFLAAAPVAYVAYDILEAGGADLRELSQLARRARLAEVAARLDAAPLRLSPLVERATWDGYAKLRTQSRSRGAEGLMLKRRDAPYGIGRTGNAWWKWKVDPMTVDAVLVYAQRGHGRHASLYTDYTLAVWDTRGGTRALTPFAKAHSELSAEETGAVDRIVRKTTIEKFGPVRGVTPTLVFELAFEGIKRSPRHKSGIAVRSPRIVRWRTDKGIDEADTIEALEALLR